MPSFPINGPQESKPEMSFHFWMRKTAARGPVWESSQHQKPLTNVCISPYNRHAFSTVPTRRISWVAWLRQIYSFCFNGPRRYILTHLLPLSLPSLRCVFSRDAHHILMQGNFGWVRSHTSFPDMSPHIRESQQLVSIKFGSQMLPTCRTLSLLG